MSRLAIGYMLSGQAADVVNDLRRRYDPEAAAVVGAHVTLAGPGEGEAAEVAERLRDLAVEVEPFEVVVGGADTFLPVTPVAYLRIAPVERLIALHDLLQSRLNWRDEFAYVPHVTVCEYLSRDQTEAALKDPAMLRVCEYDVISTLTLVSEGEDGVWRPVCECELGKA